MGQKFDDEKPACETTPIQEFYRNSTIFVTGATGFVGITLVEKLLRSCHGINKIYYLVRAKRGANVNERHLQLIKSPVFNRIRQENFELLKKLIPIKGDTSEVNLGISSHDQEVLSEEVNVVFHAAATIRFDEKLKGAYTTNVGGTVEIINLCKTMKNFKALVYVSTAYSNADKCEIEEKVYTSPAKVDKILYVCRIVGAERQEAATEKLLRGHPNTYTFTKAIAETVINQNAEDIPACIVRPSIIGASLKEPFPGWIGNLAAASGMLVQIGRGSLRFYPTASDSVLEIIPVDIVVNTLITAAREASRNPNAALVYNCTPSVQNFININYLGQLTAKYFKKYPWKLVTFYPTFKVTKISLLYWFNVLIYLLIPALLQDFYSYCTGQRVYMYKLAQKLIAGVRAFTFFCDGHWNFHQENVIKLHEAIGTDLNDRDNFPVLMENMDWKLYIENYILGIRVYALNDGLESLPAARKRLSRIYLASKIMSYSFYSCVLLFAAYIYNLLIRFK